jgi:transposase
MTKKQRTEAALAKLNRNQQIIALYTDGTDVRTISTTMDVSQSTIFNVLEKNNIPLKINHFTTATIQYAISLYNAPENTIKYILEQTGIRSEQTLYRHLKENNVPLRK